jgi:hypothetical protein
MVLDPDLSNSSEASVAIASPGAPIYIKIEALAHKSWSGFIAKHGLSKPREQYDFQHFHATEQHRWYGMLQLFHVSWLKSTYHLIYAVLEQLSESSTSFSDRTPNHLD